MAAAASIQIVTPGLILSTLFSTHALMSYWKKILPTPVLILSFPSPSKRILVNNFPSFDSLELSNLLTIFKFGSDQSSFEALGTKCASNIIHRLN